MQLPMLTLVTFLPLLGAIVIGFAPVRWTRPLALATALAAWVVSLVVAFGFDAHAQTSTGFQMVETLDWIPAFGIQYKLGIDGLSLALVVLTTTLSWISILASFSPIQVRVKEYMISFLILEVGMTGVFLALDTFLFYIFWEVVLVPMYLIIGIWGGQNRIYATIKFVLYTLVGSLLMLVAILATAFAYQGAHGGQWAGAFDFIALREYAGMTGFSEGLQLLSFAAFALAFAIKVPMFPFHTWLPDAHVEAPTAGSVILAGVLLKLGGYGFIRYNLSLYPDASHTYAPLIIVLSLIAIIYGAIVAMVQPDLKKLVAYSSVSHMGFVTLGIFVFQEQAMDGAILQMVNHGLITGALFLLVGVIYERTHDRTIAKMGGLAALTPVYAAAFGFFVFASAGLPGLSGFVGEFLALVGTFAVNPWAAGVATFVMILGAAYLLWMYQRVVLGEPSAFLLGLKHHLTDMTPTEILTLAPLAALVVVFGLFPGILLETFDASVVVALEAADRGSAIQVDPLFVALAIGLLAAIIAGRFFALRPGRRGGGESSTAVTVEGSASWPPRMTLNDLVVTGPFIAAVLVALGVLVVDLVAPGRRAPTLVVSLGGLAIVAALTITTGLAVAPELGVIRVEAFGGAYVVDGLTTFLDLLFITIVAFTIVFGPDYLEARGLPLAEFSVVLLFALTGAMLIAASADLLILFIALELMVLPGYMLAGFHKTDGYSTEGAIKYFLLGSFSSAIFLFGLAFAWGTTGTTSIAGVSDALAAIVAGSEALSPALVLGLGFMTTGVAFKIAAVPFHYWTPDAYQGSPTPVTGYLSVGPKVGAFALILRLFVEALGPLQTDWLLVVVVLAVVTMTLGNLVALTQSNVKRMLAYSSIAHTGYMLVGLAAFAAGRIEGLEGLLYYGAAYSFMNLGAFAVVAAIQRRAGVTSGLDTFAGLGRREPWLAILMTLFLLSLTGIPPTAGFFAKAYVILAAVQASDAGWTSLGILAVVAVLNAAAAAFYYLRVVVYMFMREPKTEQAPMEHGRLLWGGLVVASVLTIVLGLIPGPFLVIVGDAARAIGS